MTIIASLIIQISLSVAEIAIGAVIAKYVADKGGLAGVCAVAFIAW